MELFSFPWLHPLCIGRQKVSERMSLYWLKKKQVLSLSKLVCVMGFCLEGVEPADKQHAGLYICLFLLYNPNSATQRVCIISIRSISNIY